MRIRQVGDEYELLFGYDPSIVSAIKTTIPGYARRFDRDTKAWYVHSSAYSILQQLGSRLNVNIPAPNKQAVAQTQTIQVIYIGKSKIQSTGEAIHNGTTGHELVAQSGLASALVWDVAITEKEMRRWFHADNTVSSGSLYGVLGVLQSATLDEIKSGFRRMARQWHPDICHEDNAQEMFMRINRAYETLSDKNMRLRYDAGLQFEAMSQTHVESLLYAPPLRCGMITGKVKKVGARNFIETIEDWQDIVVDNQVLVTSWSRNGLVKNYVQVIGR